MANVTLRASQRVVQYIKKVTQEDQSSMTMPSSSACLRITSISIWVASDFARSSAFDLITLRANSIDPPRGGGADVAVALGASCAKDPRYPATAAVNRSPGPVWGAAAGVFPFTTFFTRFGRLPAGLGGPPEPSSRPTPSGSNTIGESQTVYDFWRAERFPEG